MPLAKIDFDGAVPPLKDGEYLECVDCGECWGPGDTDELYAPDYETGRCPVCAASGKTVEGAGFRGFVRVNPESRDIVSRWGPAGSSFVAVPDVLVAHLAALDLDALDFTLIAMIERHRWRPGQWVYPSVRRFRLQSGLGDRTIRSHLRRLEDRGLLAVRARYFGGQQRSNEYDLAGLRELLNIIYRNVSAGRSPVRGLAAAEKRLRRQRRRTRAQTTMPQRRGATAAAASQEPKKRLTKFRTKHGPDAAHRGRDELHGIESSHG